MTDASFEGRLGSLLVTYAEGGVRPIDAAAIATATIDTGRPRSVRERLRGGAFGGIRVTPRVVLLAVVALLAIAIAVTVVGRQAQLPPKLADRQPLPSPAIAPRPSPAPRAPDAIPAPRIAYVQDGGVFVAGRDGSDPIKVLADPGVAFTDVRWLSDGRHVVVAGADQDFVLDLATGEHHRLEIPEGFDVPPDAAWQPGGDQVAALRHTPTGETSTVLVLDALTGVSREIPADPHLAALAWSADGLALAAVIGHDFVRVDPMTGTSTVVATTANGADPEAVVWTADLDRVAYVETPENPCEMTTKTCESGPSDIYVADANAGSGGASIKIAGPLRQSRLNGDNSVTVFGPPPTPAWSPDGRWIAYRTADGLAIVHPDGTGTRLIVTVAVEVFQWRADGSGVTFTAAAASGPSRELFDVDLDGGAPRSLRLVGVDRFAATAGTVRIPTLVAAGTSPSASPTTMPAAAPTPSPSMVTSETVPSTHRLLISSDGADGCKEAVTELDLDTLGHRQIGTCLAGMTPDGRHLIQAATVLDVRDGSAAAISGRHEASPTGRWLITPPVEGNTQPLGTTDWEVKTWDGRLWMTLPRAWWNPTYGPYLPTWSPDDSHVAIRTKDALVMVDLVTRQQWTLTSIPAIWSWSSDGQRIAFVNRGVDGDAWIANADGTGMRNVSGFEFGGADGVVLSPDGSTAAVTQGRRLWLIGDDSSRRAVDIHALFGDKLVQVTWSPDGQRLALVADADIPDEGPSHGLTVMIDRDGRVLASVEAGSASWSPTGQTLAAVKSWITTTTAHVSNEQSTTYLIDRDGATHTLRHAWQPTWAPDGTMLAIFTDPPTTRHVDIVRADGTGRHRAVPRAFRRADELVWER